MLGSEVHPAYDEPGGGQQYFTGTKPRAFEGDMMDKLTGLPKERTLPDGRTVPVHPVDRTGGPLSYQYGNDWKVDTMSPEEAEEIRRLEEQQAKQPKQFDDL
jgi:hypothetical protein